MKSGVRDHRYGDVDVAAGEHDSELEGWLSCCAVAVKLLKYRPVRL